MEKMWIKTDDLQFVAKISEREFEIIDITQASSEVFLINYIPINLDKYDTSEVLEAIRSYGYNDIEDIVDLYGDDANQIIAECIAELDGSFIEILSSIDEVSKWLSSIDKKLKIA